MLTLALNLYACWVCMASAVHSCLPSVWAIRYVLGLMLPFGTPSLGRVCLQNNLSTWLCVCVVLWQSCGHLLFLSSLWVDQYSSMMCIWAVGSCHILFCGARGSWFLQFRCLFPGRNRTHIPTWPFCYCRSGMTWIGMHEVCHPGHQSHLFHDLLRAHSLVRLGKSYLLYDGDAL